MFRDVDYETDRAEMSLLCSLFSCKTVDNTVLRAMRNGLYCLFMKELKSLGEISCFPISWLVGWEASKSRNGDRLVRSNICMLHGRSWIRPVPVKSLPSHLCSFQILFNASPYFSFHWLKLHWKKHFEFYSRIKRCLLPKPHYYNSVKTQF